MNAGSALIQVLSALNRSEVLLEPFLGENERLRKLPRIEGWHGRCRYGLDGQEYTRGRAYCLVNIPAQEWVAAVAQGGTGAVSFLAPIVQAMATGLGKAVEMGMVGGGDVSFADLHRLAEEKWGQLAAGASGIRQIDSTDGQVFHHLGGLPHLALDEDVPMRLAAHDGFQIRMRMFGNVIPYGCTESPPEASSGT